MGSNNFMQVGPGGICFVHGPYTERHCPEFFTSGSPCVTNSQNPEYIAMAQEQMRRTNKVYTQAEMDAALTTARREQREANAEIAKSMAKNWARMVGAPFSNSSHYSGLADGASQVAAAIRRTGGGVDEQGMACD